jgi:acetyl-CoA carboxylase biotin carboxyl carrier protein
MTDDDRSPRLTPAELVDTVRALADVMARSGITKVDVGLGDTRIRLRGHGQPVAPVSRETELGLLAANGTSTEEPALVITAPMIGVFYRSPAPHDPPFVEVGDQVVVGQTIGIIEAMKIMNEIAATHAGTVQSILVTNAQAVEYGSPLLRLTPPPEGQS